MGGFLAPQRTVGRLIGIALLLGAILAAASWFGVLQSGRAASSQLAIHAPDEALAGELIAVQLVVNDANGIAAFDATIRFDTETASLQSFDPRDNDLANLGRDVRGLGPVEVPDGIIVGAYTCPVADCADPTAKERSSDGGVGTFRLASFSLVAYQAGPLTLDLSSAQFADALGNPVEVDLSGATVTIEILPNAEVE